MNDISSFIETDLSRLFTVETFKNFEKTENIIKKINKDIEYLIAFDILKNSIYSIILNYIDKNGDEKNNYTVLLYRIDKNGFITFDENESKIVEKNIVQNDSLFNKDELTLNYFIQTLTPDCKVYDKNEVYNVNELFNCNYILYHNLKLALNIV